MIQSDLRCSTWARAHQVDPIGTAGSYRGLLLVEWPLPWPRDVAEIPELATLAAMTRSAGIRLQAVVPSGDRGLRVGWYRWNGATARYDGVEAPAEPSPAATAMALLEGTPPAGTERIEVRDVLICGHGARDRCCGALGTALQIETAGQGTLGVDAGVRVRRTSHTGGHRFAPTAIVLPEGTVWGYLDPELLGAIVTRRKPAIEVAGHYRGCCGLTSPGVQALERSVLATVGWAVLDRPRSGTDHGDGRVSLDISFEAGARRWEGLVVTRRVLPVPPCGVPLTGSEKTEAELGVGDLAEAAI